MAIYDNDLDPFDDGSLLESYLFEGTLENEQGTRTLSKNDDEEFNFTDGVYGDSRELGNISDTTNPLDGQINCSVSCWLHALDINDGSAAMIGDTYYAGIYLTSERKSATEVEISVALSYDTEIRESVTIDSAKKWFFVSATYNVTTGDAKLFLDGVEIGASNETGIDFSSGYGMIVHGYNYGRVDQLMIWSKELSLSEVNSLYTMEKHLEFIDLLIVSDSTTISTIDFNVVSSVIPLSFIDFEISSENKTPEYIDFNIVSVAHKGELIDLDIISTNIKDPEFINLNIISENIPSDAENPESYNAQIIRRIL